MNHTKAKKILMLALLVLAWGCSKKHESAPANSNNNNNNTTTKSPYYFMFTLNGANDTIYSDGSKIYTDNTNAVLAGVSGNQLTLEPDISLRFSLPVWYDTVVESEVLGLAGKTLYFTDTIMQPEIEYQANDTAARWYSSAYADSSYYVKVTSVSFLASDNYEGYPVRTYVISGSCHASMRQLATILPLTGTFNLILARVNYK